MKKQSNLSRLMGYAGGHKILTYLSWVLSVMSALLALVPFWYIWRIIHDILEVSPDFSKAGNVTSYGWSAVLFAVISIVVYIAALMCSHLSAFRVAANIRKELMRHITALPLGVTEKYGSGNLRRIVNTSSAATDLSCTQAARQSGSDCYPHRAALSTACFRLAVRAFESCSRCAWLFDYDENDRKRHGAENGTIPKFTFRHVK